jgi:hypothetical protein
MTEIRNILLYDIFGSMVGFLLSDAKITKKNIFHTKCLNDS